MHIDEIRIRLYQDISPYSTRGVSYLMMFDHICKIHKKLIFPIVVCEAHINAVKFF